MKYFIVVLEIILLCFTCAASVAAPSNEVPEPIPVVRSQEIERPRPQIILPEKQEEEEFADARFIWNYLKDLEYSDVVCAGIMGNLMVEVGGNTLDLQPEAKTDECYGICQWKKEYYPEIWGAPLEEQCDYLRDTIEYEIRVFSKYYSYEDFLAIDNVREAALVFANSYERCSEKTYELRQDCAEVAYEYFVEE